MCFEHEENHVLISENTQCCVVEKGYLQLFERHKINESILRRGLLWQQSSFFDYI